GPGVRVDSGLEAGGEVTPMYDPMVAKLIVWDVDREQATRRMLRALEEYEIEGLKTLIPLPKAILATDEWARAETARNLVEDRSWLKQLAFEKAPKPDEEGEDDKVEQSYTVEVSGKRFDVRVIGAPIANGSAPAAAAAPAARKPRRERSSSGGG